MLKPGKFNKRELCSRVLEVERDIYRIERECFSLCREMTSSSDRYRRGIESLVQNEGIRVSVRTVLRPLARDDSYIDIEGFKIDGLGNLGHDCAYGFVDVSKVIDAHTKMIGELTGKYHDLQSERDMHYLSLIQQSVVDKVYSDPRPKNEVFYLCVEGNLRLFRSESVRYHGECMPFGESSYHSGHNFGWIRRHFQKKKMLKEGERLGADVYLITNFSRIVDEADVLSYVRAVTRGDSAESYFMSRLGRMMRSDKAVDCMKC